VATVPDSGGRTNRPIDDAAPSAGDALPGRGGLSSASAVDDLFDGGPPLKLQARIGLVQPGRFHGATRALLFVAITWLPLLILAAVEGNLRGREGGIHFLLDLGSVGRYVVAGPLMIAGEAVCIRMLGKIVRRLVELCETEGVDSSSFLDVLASIRRWRDAPMAEVVVVLAAFGASFAVIRAAPPSQLPVWHGAGADRASLSLAGWWYAVVSLPLLLMLILGWAWRLVLWIRLLFAAARLRLQLVAVHPDKSGGLGFFGRSVRAFALFGAALGAIVAGTVANEIVHRGAPLAEFKYMVLALVAGTVIVFTGPLLILTPMLHAAWRRGAHEYDELATAFGLAFERAWFAQRKPRDQSLLEREDFSAATDLYQVVDRVHDMRLIPVDYKSVAVLAGATLLPFIPVVIIALPFDVMLDTLVGLLR